MVNAPKAKRDCCTGILDAETILVTKADGKLVKVRLLGVSAPGTQRPSDAPPVNATPGKATQDKVSRQDLTKGKATQKVAPEVDTTLARAMRAYRREPIHFMESYILGEPVILEVDPSSAKVPDSNMLAYVYRVSNSRTLNELMILNGMGVVQRDPEFGKLEQFNEAERIARTRLAGYWRWLKVEEARARFAKATVKADNERRAETWLKMGNNLWGTNTKAAREYYTDILKTYPDTESAPVARRRLKLLLE
jgi:endonuclease YncB( thermonuclease family)